MKIGIIGGGFYGTYTAIALKKAFPEAIITVLEKNADILQEAISNNQHRLHLGFHYPRCPDTIKQASKAYYKFLELYGDCCEPIKNNYYAVHKNSFVNFEKYRAIYEAHQIPFEDISLDSVAYLFKSPEEIEGVIRVDEQKINLSKLKLKIRQQLADCEIDIHTYCNVANNFDFSQFDIIINATYSNPNVALSDKQFEVKYEVCALGLISSTNSNLENTAITIMDGQFVSVYPADRKNTFTVSSVTYTPYMKTFDLSIAKTLLGVLEANIGSCIQDVSKHVNEYLNLGDYTQVGYYLTLKAKPIHDTNDFRSATIIKDKNFPNRYGILPGKISAALLIAEELIKDIKNG